MDEQSGRPTVGRSDPEAGNDDFGDVDLLARRAATYARLGAIFYGRPDPGNRELADLYFRLAAQLLQSIGASAATRLDALQIAREGIQLAGVNLRGADLRGADLRGANLGGADLSKVDLTGADLAEAYLGGADLTGATLAAADMWNADLRHSRVDRDQLASARNAASTRFDPEMAASLEAAGVVDSAAEHPSTDAQAAAEPAHRAPALHEPQRIVRRVPPIEPDLRLLQVRENTGPTGVPAPGWLKRLVTRV